MNATLKYCAILLLLNLNLLGQVLRPGPESSNWYFGENAFIKFDVATNKITAGTGPLVTEEGCATISDKLGNVLFYCTGETVWNRFDQVMFNGEGLYGGYSSTQASLIIQKPGSNDLFYIFNTGNLGTDLYYSIVDMSKENGLGSVISKNNILYTNVSEKLTACYAQNGYDVWVITKSKLSHTYLSFIINSEEIITNPVLSPVNLDFDITHKYSAMGYLKFSPDGRFLASASYSSGQFELYEFDNITGHIALRSIIKADSGLNAYGVSFSSNGKYLYTTSFNYDTYLYQYDISVLDSAEINKSKELIAEFHDGFGLGAIAEGPDEKLYISHYKRSYLASIDSPDLKGKACSFRDESVYLNGERARLGLPNFSFVNTYFEYKPDPLKYDVFIWTQSIEAAPGDEKKIRIFAKLLKDSTRLINENLEAEVVFDAACLEPQMTSFIEGNQIKTRFRRLKIGLHNITLDSNETLIAEIPGIVLFGDKQKYEMRLENIQWSDTSIRTYSKFGILTINEVCKTDLRHIGTVKNVMNLTPMPVNEKIKINFLTGDKGNYRISIFDMQGSEVRQKLLGYYDANNYSKIILDTDNLQNGLYFVVLYINDVFLDNRVMIISK